MSEHEDEKFWRKSLGLELHDGTMFEVLERFFQERHDQELGRWRWPENPDFVVYPKEASVIEPDPGVRVVNEVTGRSRDIGPRKFLGTLGTSLSLFGEAADAYFKAHPAPKPWQDAKPGEVWALTDGLLDRERVCVRSNNGFRSTSRKNVFLDESRIIAGRRIWPEVSDA